MEILVAPRFLLIPMREAHRDKNRGPAMKRGAQKPCVVAANVRRHAAYPTNYVATAR